MTRNPHPGSGPTPSELALYELWDHIDRTRQQHGEQAAQDLATKALKAVAPPTQKDKQPC